MSVDGFRDQIRGAAAAGVPLRIRGAGSKDFYGNEPAGEILDTTGHAGIAAYEPTELYVTARGGTPLAQVERELASRNQMLAFEPPRFGGGATVGGAVAAGLSGPRRARAGAVRDFVLGLQLVDGRGDVLRFGGTVMKNVAGYDVSRLLAGSLGTLGLIAEVTLKVLPRPEAEQSLRFALPQDAALRQLHAWGGQPLPLSASAWHDGVLTVRLSGAAAAVRDAQRRLGGEALAEAAGRDFWLGVRDQTLPFFASAPLWRLAVPSTTPPLALPGEVFIEWDGGLRWVRSAAEAKQIRGAAAAAGGHATLFRADPSLKRDVGAFQPLPPALRALHGRVKQAFDPRGILGPGRIYPDL